MMEDEMKRAEELIKARKEQQERTPMSVRGLVLAAAGFLFNYF